MLFIIVRQWTAPMLRGNFVQQKTSEKNNSDYRSRAETGAAIADKLSEGNYRLLLVQMRLITNLKSYKTSNRNNLHAEVEIVDCAKEGCWEADIIILAIPYHKLKKVIEKINEVVTQKIVLIISNENESSFSFNQSSGVTTVIAIF